MPPTTQMRLLRTDTLPERGLPPPSGSFIASLAMVLIVSILQACSWHGPREVSCL
jgi:hypothetical protein